MILFINVFITNNGQGFKYDRGMLGPSGDRVDVFKYSLASLSVIPWSQIVVHYELSEECRHREKELDAWIQAQFPAAVIHHYQNQYQHQWQAVVEELEKNDDPLVLFCCNDDHIFIDFEIGLLRRVEAACRDRLKSSPYLSMVPTHWPEYVTNATWASEQTSDYLVVAGQCTNSMQVISKALLRYWWFAHDYGQAWMPRTDTGTLLHSPDGGSTGAKRFSVIGPKGYTVVVPFRELICHYDGYSHVSVDLNACPPLSIPPGFFDNRIQIAYGAQSKKLGEVLVNPLKANYTAVDPEGADLKCLLDDLPLFWRSRIGRVVQADGIDPDQMICQRNRAVVDAATQCSAVSVQKLQAALRFSPNQTREAQIAELEAFLQQRRFHQFYEERSRSRTAPAIAAAQEFLRWRQDRQAQIQPPSSAAA